MSAKCTTRLLPLPLTLYDRNAYYRQTVHCFSSVFISYVFPPVPSSSCDHHYIIYIYIYVTLLYSYTHMPIIRLIIYYAAQYSFPSSWNIIKYETMRAYNIMYIYLHDSPDIYNRRTRYWLFRRISKRKKKIKNILRSPIRRNNNVYTYAPL